jgi:hypothetical protein
MLLTNPFLSLSLLFQILPGLPQKYSYKLLNYAMRKKHTRLYIASNAGPIKSPVTHNASKDISIEGSIHSIKGLAEQSTSP